MGGLACTNSKYHTLSIRTQRIRVLKAGVGGNNATLQIFGQAKYHVLGSQTFRFHHPILPTTPLLCTMGSDSPPVRVPRYKARWLYFVLSQ
jgi:hypothetical protein